MIYMLIVDEYIFFKQRKLLYMIIIRVEMRLVCGRGGWGESLSVFEVRAQLKFLIENELIFFYFNIRLIIDEMFYYYYYLR